MRLDTYLVQEGLCQSRDRAKALIQRGDCVVNGVVVKKPAHKVQEEDVIELGKEDFSYVGRGGLKLEAALDRFGIEVKEKVALDVGVATGGFTDCLLQRGARKLYAVDVGKGQLADSLRLDERVVFMPQTDARDLEKRFFQDDLDIVVVDVSFISITALLEALRRVGSTETEYILLVKPQFETGQPHSGVLRKQKVIQEALERVREALNHHHFTIVEEMDSPITGKEGNKEFLWHVR